MRKMWKTERKSRVRIESRKSQYFKGQAKKRSPLIQLKRKPEERDRELWGQCQGNHREEYFKEPFNNSTKCCKEKKNMGSKVSETDPNISIAHISKVRLLQILNLPP
jgi:hypothetical protein